MLYEARAKDKILVQETMEFKDGFVWVNDSDCVDPLRDELEETKKQLSEEQIEKNSANAKLLQLQEKHEELTAECLDLKKQSERLWKEREDLTQRLSKEMSDKVASDESSVENISIKNRPMVVAEEYERLFSEEWLEAKTMLDSNTDLDEEKKISLLCDIFMAAVTNARTKYTQRLTEFQQNFSHPLRNSATDKIARYPREVTKKVKRTKDTADTSMSVDPDQLIQTKHAKYEDADFVHITEISDTGQFQSEGPKEGKRDTYIMNEIGDYYRKTADSVDLKGILTDIGRFLSQKKVSDGWVSLVEGEVTLQDYMKVCARIAWKMAIQRPSMMCYLKGLGEKWDPVTQEVAYGSDDPTHALAVVKLYHYPALYHGERLMAKGKVIVKIQ